MFNPATFPFGKPNCPGTNFYRNFILIIIPIVYTLYCLPFFNEKWFT